MELVCDVGASVGPVVRVPLTVHDGGTVEVSARIRVAGQYALWLYFCRANVPFEKMAQLLGEKLSGHSSGVPIPIRWEVLDAVGGAELASGDQITNGSNSWSRSEAGRLISFLQLSPGLVRLRATIKSPVPQFAEIQSHLELEFPK